MPERRKIAQETAKHYQKAVTKKEKSEILSVFMTIMGYKNRNYAARLLRTHGKTVKVSANSYVKADITKKAKRSGRKRKYDKEFVKYLTDIWKISGEMCGKRLKAILINLAENLVRYEHMVIPREIMEKLHEISPATIDRILKSERKKQLLNKRKHTQRGSLLKNEIEIRAWGEWKENQPGYMEVDLISHEGGDNRGDYAFTLTIIDVYSGWTESAAIKNKAARWVLEALKNIKDQLPFDLKGIDSDNGSEFINRPLVNFCKENNIKFTRGRSGWLNDNCYVEQKNFSILRRHVGYWRYDTPEEVKVLNELYSYLRLYTNFFQPVMKLTKKKRIGSKVIKEHNDIQTPYMRLVDNSHLTVEQKEKLKEQFEGLDIWKLHHAILACYQKLDALKKTKHQQRQEAWR